MKAPPRTVTNWINRHIKSYLVRNELPPPFDLDAYEVDRYFRTMSADERNLYEPIVNVEIAYELIRGDLFLYVLSKDSDRGYLEDAKRLVEFRISRSSRHGYDLYLQPGWYNYNDYIQHVSNAILLSLAPSYRVTKWPDEPSGFCLQFKRGSTWADKKHQLCQGIYSMKWDAETAQFYLW